MKSVFAVVAATLQSLPATVAVANACDKAYNDATGGTYTPFDETNQSMVAMNAAGLYAIVTAASQVAVVREGVDKDGNVSETSFTAALEDIANWDTLSQSEQVLVAHAANLAWRAGQPFRALERLTRPVNTDFNLLPANEKDKDKIQLTTAARFLLEEISRD